MKTKNVSALEAYDAWRRRTLLFNRNLQRLQQEFEAVSMIDLDLPVAEDYFRTAQNELAAAVKAASIASKDLSHNDLLGWVGPFGAVSHITERCRDALEQWGLFRHQPGNLSGLCAEASYLLRKKLRPFVKVEVVEGVVRGETHYWCEKNGVAIDLTYTQFSANASRVYVLPSAYYSAVSVVPVRDAPSKEVLLNVAEIEKYYTCDHFVRRKKK